MTRTSTRNCGADFNGILIVKLMKNINLHRIGNHKKNIWQNKSSKSNRNWWEKGNGDG